MKRWILFLSYPVFCAASSEISQLCSSWFSFQSASRLRAPKFFFLPEFCRWPRFSFPGSVLSVEQQWLCLVSRRPRLDFPSPISGAASVCFSARDKGVLGSWYRSPDLLFHHGQEFLARVPRPDPSASPWIRCSAAISQFLRRVLLSVGPGSLLRPGIYLRISLACQPVLRFCLASQDLVVPSLPWSPGVETVPFVLVPVFWTRL